MRPNLVYIDCHDLGDWLACYGRPWLDTPHLDALAAQGARFCEHIAAAPICMPSRAAIYTGLCGRLMVLNDPTEMGFTEQPDTGREEQAATAAAFLEEQCAAQRAGVGDSPFLLSVSRCIEASEPLPAMPAWRQ